MVKGTITIFLSYYWFKQSVRINDHILYYTLLPKMVVIYQNFLAYCYNITLPKMVPCRQCRGSSVVAARRIKNGPISRTRDCSIPSRPPFLGLPMPLRRLGGVLLLWGHPLAPQSTLRPGDETASESLTLLAQSTTDVSSIYRRHDTCVTREHTGN